MEPQLKAIIKKLIAKTNEKNIYWEQASENHFNTTLYNGIVIGIGIYELSIYKNGERIYRRTMLYGEHGAGLLRKLYDVAKDSSDNNSEGLFKDVLAALDFVFTSGYVQTVFPEGPTKPQKSRLQSTTQPLNS
jgi:hypothetical protein